MTPDRSRNRAMLSGETMLRYRPPPRVPRAGFGGAAVVALGVLVGALGAAKPAWSAETSPQVREAATRFVLNVGGGYSFYNASFEVPYSDLPGQVTLKGYSTVLAAVGGSAQFRLSSLASVSVGLLFGYEPLSGACGERVHYSCKYRAAGFPLGLQAGFRTRPIARAREWYLGFGVQVVELLVSGSVSGTLVPGLDRGAYADASEREGIFGFPNGEFLGELLVETGLDVASVWRVGLQASLGVDVGQGDGATGGAQVVLGRWLN